MTINGVTTAAILESVTDRSKFERLATSVLRKADPLYAAIIQTGINAQGESIVSPVDGLHLVPYSNPPHWIFVQHTTTDRNRLRSKWLSNEDADLSKAVAEANKVRKDQPNAVFTVVLATNQRVDEQLVIDVSKRAKDVEVNVDIWEQSRLVDFLDSERDGHWLRRFYLGIEAERLSTDLLHQLGQKSLELYRQEMLLPGQEHFIHRNITESIFASALPGGPRLCLVMGQSGYGKSVATIESLDRWLSVGSLGLWLPARVFRDATSMESVLDTWLRSLHPSLEPNAGQVALDLANESGRLLLCVDDINRTPEAARLLQIAIGVAAPSSNASSNASGSERPEPPNALCQVVPIWPNQLSSLPAKMLDQPWIQTIPIEELLPDESSELIRGRIPRLSVAEAHRYAIRLNHDPLLVGLFTLMAGEEMDLSELDAVADDAIGEFVKIRLQDLCSHGDPNILPAELLDVLVNLAREMILRRNLQPSLMEIETWFGDSSKVMRGMRLLVRHEQICKLDAEQQLAFRHDRLLERFLVQAMTDLMNSPEPREDIITDPYFSMIVGKALAQTELPEKRVSHLRTYAPWSLFEAIRHVGEPSSDYHNRLFKEASNWISTESNGVRDSVLTAICWSLIETDSSQVLPIVDAAKPNPMLMVAGLRNGSAEHGMRFVRSRIQFCFEPGMGDDLRDRIVEHAGHLHGENIAKQIREQLSRSDLTVLDTNAYLALLGHFRFTNFDQLIVDAWKRHKDEVLYYAIWAAARCPLQNVDQVLCPLIERVAALPVREDYTKSLGEREQMTLHLSWGFRRGVTPEAISCLINTGLLDSVLRHDVSLMVEGVDHPDALEYLVRCLADGGGSNLWSQLTGIGDGEPQVRLRSTKTNDRLQSIWQSIGELEQVRTYAFCLWLQTTGCKDTELLATVKSDSPFYRNAVQHRIKLHDMRVLPELLILLRSGDMHGWWWVFAHRVWCDELQSLASESLAALGCEIPTDFTGGHTDPNYHFAKLLVTVPPKNGESLLLQHWGQLKYSSMMIAAALRIGTPACMELAKESLAIYPVEADVFKHTLSFAWKQRNAANPITLRHLKNLDPYLDRMSHDAVLQFAWETERVVGSDEGCAEWIREHLIPRLLPEERRCVRVADEMLVDRLDHTFQETKFSPHLGFLFEERGGQQYVFPDRQIRLLGEWLSKHRTARGLDVVAECLKHIGRRQDLDLLDRYPIEGIAVEIQQIKADARFAVWKRTLK